MKFFLIGIVVLGMAYVGVGISLFYRQRKKFFNDIILLCEKLCVEISFSKEKLKTILTNNLESFSKELKDIVKRFVSFLETNGMTIEKETLFRKKCVLKDEEKKLFCFFLKVLEGLTQAIKLPKLKVLKQGSKSSRQPQRKKTKNLERFQ